MSRTTWNPEIGALPANKGGKHGGISPAGGECDYSHTTAGSSGNPGTEFPWEGSDSTAIGANTAPPAIPYLGGKP